VVGKRSKSKAGAARDTVTSPVPPAYGIASAPGAVAQPPEPELGARSSERVLLGAGSKAKGRCLVPHEALVYLGPGCPKDLRVRVESHIADCAACRRWVRHVDDEVLDYIGGQCSDTELARMDAHLDACDACRDLVHHVVQGMAQSWQGEGRDLSDSSTTFSLGSVVNSRYLIRSFLGRGGMGEVYEALDQLMGTRVALKTVLCTVADRPRAARRFKEEVLNAQRVGHPHVCRINELQEHHEGMLSHPLPFFTMEFIDGERLERRLRQGPMPLSDVRIIALQLLDGLKAAHMRGVLHLDFKSDNVMLRRDTEKPDAVIMDFGLSRILGNESRMRTSERHQFAGTLPYMSVEQLECRDDLGPATDVYAFGVLLYEMLTQVLPFKGDSLSAVLLKQLKERPETPSRRAPGLAPALDRFVLKCLSSNARSRYADAGEALSALEAVGSWERAGRTLRHWKPLAALSLAALPLAAVGVAAWIVGTSAPRRPPVEPGPALVSSAGTPATPDVQQVIRVLTPAPTPTPTVTLTPPPTALEPALPSALPASAPKPRRAVQPHEAKAAARDVAPRSVPPTEASQPAAAEAPSPAPARVEPGRADSASDDLARSEGKKAWKPARVPKRLVVPAAPAGDAKSSAP
jgi:Protein kinase domain/Putative zinc-finger